MTLLVVAAGLAALALVALVVWRGRRVAVAVCAQLGLDTDPFARLAAPSDAHRCYANLARERVDLGHQQRFCLSSAHGRCPFLALKARRPDGRLEQARVWGRSVSPAVQALVVRLGRKAAESGPALVHLRALRSALVLPKGQVAAGPLQPPVRDTGAEHSAVTDVAPTWAHAIEAEVATVPEHRALVEQPAAVEESWVLDQAAAGDGEVALIQRGVEALEAGREAEAFGHFKRATQAEPRAARAWYWRAKTAETLDEVIHCLERAAKLEPSNEQIVVNLESARLRRTLAQHTAAAPKHEPRPTPTLVTVNSARSSAGWRLVRLVRDLARATAALAAFVVAAAWLLGALPPELKALVGAVSGLPTVGLPTGGYQLVSALPFGLGFLALFVGVGVISGDGWTRLWAPAVGLASAWVWTMVPGAAAALHPVLLPACGAVVIGGALSSEWRVLRLD